MLGDNIKKIRKLKKISINKMSEITGISLGYLSQLENNLSSNPTQVVLDKIADTLGVSRDRLTGASVTCFIEDRLNLLNMTLEELSEKTKIPIDFFKELDNVQPMGNHYELMDRIAYALNMHPGILRAALARQEPPAYDGPPTDPKEDFDYKEDFPQTITTVRESEVPYNITPITGRLVTVPILGKIPAGIPVEATENIIGYVDVPESKVRNGSYFYLQVQGDSMINSGIKNGYQVLVRRQDDVESGEIAVVRVNSHDATLKRVKKIDGQVILYPDNPAYEPIIIKEEGAEFIGKVVKVEFDPNKKY